VAIGPSVKFKCSTCGQALPDTRTFCPACRTSFVGRPLHTNSRRDRLVPLPPGPYAAPSRFGYPPVVSTEFDEEEPRRRGAANDRGGVVVVVMLAASAAGVSYVRAGEECPTPASGTPVSRRSPSSSERAWRPFKHPVSVDFPPGNTGPRGASALPATLEVSDDRDNLANDPFVLIIEDDITFASILLDLARDSGLKGVISTAGSGTLAFYSPRDQRVRVRGSEMTPGLRVTVAHELTHALQDQYFDLSDKRLAEESTLRPIIEGDATRIEKAYEAQVLTDAEREQKATADEAERSAYTGQLAASNVPSVLSTAFELPYALGPQFVAITAALGGNTAVDALIIRPPARTCPCSTRCAPMPTRRVRPCRPATGRRRSVGPFTDGGRSPVPVARGADGAGGGSTPRRHGGPKRR
jgi:hypothetical protein